MTVYFLNKNFALSNIGILLIFISFSIILSFSRVKANLLIILLKSSKILTSFGELSLLHTLSNIPVNKSSLGIHEVELVVQPSPGFSNSCGIGEHTDCTSNLGSVSTGHNCWWLVVNPNFESCRTPVNKLDAPLSLDGCDGSIHILGDHISSVEKTASHVLAMTGITLHHLVSRLKTSIGDLRHSDLLMVSLLSRDDGSIGHKREVDPRVGHQVSLELGQVNVQSSIKSKGSSDGRDNLANHAVEIRIRWSFNIQIPAADIINSLIINHESTIRMLKGSMGGQNSVVRLNNSSSNLRCWVDGKLQLGLFAVVYRQALHKKRSKSRSGSPTKRMEKKKSLKSSALICKLSDSVQDQIHNLLSNGVVTTSIVVSSIFLTIDELLRMVKLLVSPTSRFINHSRL